MRERQVKDTDKQREKEREKQKDREAEEEEEGGEQKHVEFSEKTESQTAFVLNLSHATKENALKAAFEPYGEVCDVRVPKDNRGKPRGYAYVQMKNEASVEKAIAALHNTTMDGRMLSVTHSKPGVSRSTGPDPNTLFIKGLPKNLPAPQLEDMLRAKYSQCGVIKEVRLGRDKQGNLKPFAYLEFKDKSSLKSALLLDLSLSPSLPHVTLSVEKSCPPSAQDKKQHQQHYQHYQHQRPQPHVKKESAILSRGKGRSMLSLAPSSSASGAMVPRALSASSSSSSASAMRMMPRSVARPVSGGAGLSSASASASAASTPASSTAATTAKNDGTAMQTDSESPAPQASLSNDDFRKMLLTKKQP